MKQHCFSHLVDMNTTMDNEDMAKPFFAVVISCVMALGLPLNAVSLWTLLRHHGLKSPSVVFMVNLAISDLLLVFSLPLRAYYYATGTWLLGKMTCIGTMIIFYGNIRSSVIFITFISVDRLLAVVYPLRSRHLRTVSNASKAAGLVWLAMMAVNIPEAVSYSESLPHNGTICFEFPQKLNIAITYLTCVLVLTLLAVNVVCTILMSRTLHRHLSDSARVKNKVNVMLIFIMNLVMFTVCFLPATLGTLTCAKYLFTPLICLACMNCCLDPLLYYFSLDAFWKKKEDANLALDIRQH